VLMRLFWRSQTTGPQRQMNSRTRCMCACRNATTRRGGFRRLESLLYPRYMVNREHIKLQPCSHRGIFCIRFHHRKGWFVMRDLAQTSLDAFVTLGMMITDESANSHHNRSLDARSVPVESTVRLSLELLLSRLAKLQQVFRRWSLGNSRSFMTVYGNPSGRPRRAAR